jgi:hypothetical protein
VSHWPDVLLRCLQVAACTIGALAVAGGVLALFIMLSGVRPGL